MCATDSASPPLSTCPTPLNISGLASTITLNNEAVSHTQLTPSSTIVLSIPASVAPSSAYNTSRPPCNSAPQISNVDASNPSGASCNNVSSRPSRTYSTPHNNRMIPPCVIPTPFGFPVDPEVYIT